MTGVPLRVLRDGNWEVVYLSTQRSGELGIQLGKLKANCRKLRRLIAGAAKRAALVALAAGKAESADYGKLLDLSKSQDDAMAEQESLSAQLLESAGILARLALEANYGPGAVAILDALTDAQILALPGILESGETPADFFPSSVTPPSGPGLSPSPGSGAASSLSTEPSQPTASETPCS